MIAAVPQYMLVVPFLCGPVLPMEVTLLWGNDGPVAQHYPGTG